MVSLALDLDNPSLKAMALRAKGNALITVDDYHEAVDHFEEALKIFRNIAGNRLSWRDIGSLSRFI